MRVRLNYAKVAPGVYDAMDALDHYLGLRARQPLLHLVRLRASQLNGCAYCIDMHWKDLRALGETEQRLYSLDAWRECPYYTERERAALAWTEAVTLDRGRPRARRRLRATRAALHRKGARRPDPRDRHHQRVESPVDRGAPDSRRVPSGASGATGLDHRKRVAPPRPFVAGAGLKPAPAEAGGARIDLLTPGRATCDVQPAQPR